MRAPTNPTYPEGRKAISDRDIDDQAVATGCEERSGRTSRDISHDVMMICYIDGSIEPVDARGRHETADYGPSVDHNPPAQADSVGKPATD